MTAKELREKIEVAIEEAYENRDSNKIDKLEELWRRAYEVKFVKANRRLINEVEEIYSFRIFG